jgi:hypothetical protein
VQSAKASRARKEIFSRGDAKRRGIKILLLIGRVPPRRSRLGTNDKAGAIGSTGDPAVPGPLYLSKIIFPDARRLFTHMGPGLCTTL